MDLYYMTFSPPSWSVLLLNRQLDLALNLKLVDFAAEAHKTEEFSKINPVRTVPALAVDADYSLGESRAIMVYLMESQTDGNHALYPRDAKTRGRIHNRLDFDLGTLYQRFMDCCLPQWMHGPMGSEESRAKMHEALEFLEAFLGKFRYVAADHLTIADISVFASVSALDMCYFDRSKHGKVAAWYDTCKMELVGYEEVISQGFVEGRKYLTKPE